MVRWLEQASGKQGNGAESCAVLMVVAFSNGQVASPSEPTHANGSGTRGLPTPQRKCGREATIPPAGGLPPSAFLACGVAVLLLALDDTQSAKRYLQENLGIVRDTLEVYAGQGRSAAGPRQGSI